MTRHLTTRLVITTMTVVLMPSRALFAQLCIGHTSYLVRDEAGGIMSAGQVERLTIVADGVPLRLRTDSVGAEPYYYYPGIRASWDTVASVRARAFFARNPLAFSGVDGPLGFCGEIGDLTLSFAGKAMRLRFELPRHNTSFEIDSPPFQDGAFRLQNVQCRDGRPPPRIDNRTEGTCYVAADSWRHVEPGEVRHLVARASYTWFGPLPSVKCPGNIRTTLFALTSDSDWAATWRAYPDMARGNPQPKVDFATEFVLGVNQTGRQPTFTPRSFSVDGSGDLTFERAADSYDPTQCSYLYAVLPRAGVKSIAGYPLPPASTH